RSLDDKGTTPNQYIDIVRSYSDLRTVTLKLEAEGADSYSDTTAENSGGSFLRAGDGLDVRTLTGSPAVTASGENAPWEFATHAADGKLGSKWYTPTPAPGWLQFDAGVRNAGVVTGYFLTSSDFVQQRDPKDWQFQGSNDGTNWTTLDTRTAQVFATRKQTNTYTFTNTTAYRYYRLNITATYGGGSYGIALAEMVLAPVTNSTGGGWAVTNTASGEWIQFDNFTFSPGNYRFAIRYATTTANRRLPLHVAGVPQCIITLPATANLD